jgi:collagenase-like PrtC family protease
MLEPPHKPELLAPAGDWDCARAAIANGADAVYFGIDTGFNARARAANFSLADLPRLMDLLHGHGVAGYVTLNTLVFSDELAEFVRVARECAAAGVDAALVQDVGAARLLRAACPELPLHASTQMTLTSASRWPGNWGWSGWCWPANCRSRRSWRSGARPPCRWRCSSTVPCASPTRGSV